MTASLFRRSACVNNYRYGAKHGFQNRCKFSSKESTKVGTSEKAAESVRSTKEPEAKGWLKRMAPPRGGTDPPDAKFLAVAAVVCGAGFYAWFIDPPKPSEKEQA